MPLDADGRNTLVSWTLFADMTDADLVAISAYLMASEPQVNAVSACD